MWSNMDDCVKEDYGREYFDFVVNIAKMHCNSGVSRIWLIFVLFHCFLDNIFIFFSFLE